MDLDTLKAENEDLRERLAETAALLEIDQKQIAEMEAEIESLKRVVNADDRLTGMIAENLRFRELARVMEASNRGLQVGNFDLAKKLKGALWKIGQVEKQLKALEVKP